MEPRAAAAGSHLEVVTHPEGSRGLILLLRRWGVERLFAWTTRCRRLVRDDERLQTTRAGLQFVACACLALRRAAPVVLHLRSWQALVCARA